MKAEELKDVLDKHLKWLRNEPGGERAVLKNMDLSGSDLRYSNLRGSNLSGSDLSGSDLRGSNLGGSDLRGSNLSYSNLRGSNLSGSDLRGSNLRGSNLSGSDLSGSDLRGSDLRGSDLSGAKIELELLNKFFPIACPETGSFIGWKKCLNNTVVKLEILEDAKRSSAYSRKCRCSAAKVLAIENVDGTPYKKNRINSQYDGRFWYTVGEIVKVDDFDEDRRNECAPGIHFFITRQEAVDW